MNKIGDIGTRNGKVDKAANKVTIASGIRKRVAIRGRRNLNLKKIAKGAKIRHQKLVAKAGLNKGNVVRVVAGDDHVIEI